MVHENTLCYYESISLMSVKVTTQLRCKFRVSAAKPQEISIFFNKYIFGYNKYFLAYFWVENKYIPA